MPALYDRPEVEVRALNAFVKLMRSTSALQGALLPALQKEFGLTESQLGVLESLYHLGPLSQSDICQKILRGGSNVTTVVDNLERAHLVRRTRNEADRRVQIVQLTDAGRTLIARAFPVHAARISRLMSVLDEKEQRELGRLCKKLGSSIS